MHLQQFYTIMTVRIPTTLLTSHTPSTILILPLVTHVAPASSCDDGLCTSVFEVSSSLCPPQADISVSAFATNILGNGQLCDSLIIGNKY